MHVRDLLQSSSIFTTLICSLPIVTAQFNSERMQSEALSIQVFDPKNVINWC